MAIFNNLFLAICIAAIFAADHVVLSATPGGPSPAADCSSLVMDMADCLSYVTNGSTVAKPEGTCCSGMKTVLKTDAECLCEAFKSSAQLGVVLNITKAVTLPAACHVSAPSVSNCGLSSVTGAPPALAPSPTSAGATPGISIANEQAPAPAPGVSNGGVLSVSVASLIAGLVVAFFSSF